MPVVVRPIGARHFCRRLWWATSNNPPTGRGRAGEIRSCQPPQLPDEAKCSAGVVLYHMHSDFSVAETFLHAGDAGDDGAHHGGGPSPDMMFALSKSTNLPSRGGDARLAMPECFDAGTPGHNAPRPISHSPLPGSYSSRLSGPAVWRSSGIVRQGASVRWGWRGGVPLACPDRAVPPRTRYGIQGRGLGLDVWDPSGNADGKIAFQGVHPLWRAGAGLPVCGPSGRPGQGCVPARLALPGP